jgi:hypothetical protein
MRFQAKVVNDWGVDVKVSFDWTSDDPEAVAADPWFHWGSAFVERPYKWSQRWFDDPPVGTTVVLGDGLVEVHVGGGVWETRKAVGES